MSEDLFSASAPAQRIAALLDAKSLTGDKPQVHGSLLAGNGTIGSREVTVVATDRQVAGGSLGVAEARALQQHGGREE